MTSSDPLDDFVDLAERYAKMVPGTNQTIEERRAERTPTPEPDEEPAWKSNPYYRYELLLHGEKTVFYTINALAEVLGRQPGTVRRWESEGKLPKANYRTKAEGAKAGKRLYTEAQLEAISRLARIHRIAETKGSLPASFIEQVAPLFKKR